MRNSVAVKCGHCMKEIRAKDLDELGPRYERHLISCNAFDAYVKRLLANAEGLGTFKDVSAALDEIKHNQRDLTLRRAGLKKYEPQVVIT